MARSGNTGNPIPVIFATGQHKNMNECDDIRKISLVVTDEKDIPAR